MISTDLYYCRYPYFNKKYGKCKEKGNYILYTARKKQTVAKKTRYCIYYTKISNKLLYIYIYIYINIKKN